MTALASRAGGTGVERLQRLRGSRDFARVLATGAKASAGGVSCAVARRPDDGPARVGFAVPRAVGKAVVRNRVKRRLREAARALTPTLEPGFDIVIHARGDLVRKDFQELVENCRSALARAGVRC